MVVGLLRKRNEGLPIDDRRFAEAYLVVANKARMPAGQFYSFGLHALDYVHDEKVARALFVRAVEFSVGEPELVARMAQALVEKGRPDMAQAVVDRARELDIADIAMPAAAE